jgi:RimJ/RimL family protein N-acetyltransferase
VRGGEAILAPVIPELLPLPSVLEGDRVTLRPWRRGDGTALFGAIDEDRLHLARWLPWIASHTSPIDSEVYVRKALAWWILRDDLRLAIFDRDGRLSGGAGLHHLDWAARTFEIGYWLRKSAEGRGLVTESVQLLAALAFERLDATRVKLHCQTANARSAAVARRLGFDETHTREPDDRSPTGELIDLSWFSLDRDQFALATWAPRSRELVRRADADG